MQDIITLIILTLILGMILITFYFFEKEVDLRPMILISGGRQTLDIQTQTVGYMRLDGGDLLDLSTTHFFFCGNHFFYIGIDIEIKDRASLRCIFTSPKFCVKSEVKPEHKKITYYDLYFDLMTIFWFSYANF